VRRDAFFVLLLVGCTSGGSLGGPPTPVDDDDADDDDADDDDADDDDAVDDDDADDGIPSEYVFDQTELRTYEFVLDPDDWERLQDRAEDEQYVPATMLFEGAEYAGIGLRFKGAYGSLRYQGPAGGFRPCFTNGSWNRVNCPKLGMKASFNEYDREGRFAQLKKLQFHSMGSDPTMLVERLSYGLYADMSVPAPRAVHCRLVVNDELQGLFVLVEQVDGRFTRHNFPDGGEGNLYKDVWPVHTSSGPYRNALKTNEDESPSFDRMIRFAEDLAGADDSTFESVLDAWMDTDELMRQMAVDRAIEHWDGIVAWYCGGGGCNNHNYYWYESTEADRVWLVPWDLDRAMVWPPEVRTLYGMPDWDEPAPCSSIPVLGITRGRPPHCDEFIGSMARTMWPRYAAETEVLLAGPFSEASIHGRLDAIEEQIAAAVAEDPWVDADDWTRRAGQLRLDLGSMRESIAAKIAR
jgi:hypothetical protein